MEENKQFVILPSDSNLNIYPQNSASKFTVEFQSPIQFEQIQQCALFDISLPALVPGSKSCKVRIAFCPIGYTVLRGQRVWKFKDNIIHEYDIKTSYMSDIDLFYKNLIDQINNHALDKKLVMQAIVQKDGLPNNIKDEELNYENPRISFTNRYDKNNGKLIFGIKILHGSTHYNPTKDNPHYPTYNSFFHI